METLQGKTSNANPTSKIRSTYDPGRMAPRRGPSSIRTVPSARDSHPFLPCGSWARQIRCITIDRELAKFWPHPALKV
jgi:hypothetical protein